MRLTQGEIVEDVIETLTEQVLATMPCKSWPASRIRSSLMLLQYIKAAMACEAAVIDAATAAMEAWVGQAASGAFDWELDEHKRAALAGILISVPLDTAAAGEDAAARRDSYKRTLVRVAREITPGLSATSALRNSFWACLQAVRAEEQKLTASASMGLPL